VKPKNQPQKLLSMGRLQKIFSRRRFEKFLEYHLQRQDTKSVNGEAVWVQFPMRLLPRGERPAERKRVKGQVPCRVLGQRPKVYLAQPAQGFHEVKSTVLYFTYESDYRKQVGRGDFK
jgi:hypothetical protein